MVLKLKIELWNSASQNVVPGQAALEVPENLLEMQILTPTPDPLNQIAGVGPSHLL